MTRPPPSAGQEHDTPAATNQRSTPSKRKFATAVRSMPADRVHRTTASPHPAVAGWACGTGATVFPPSALAGRECDLGVAVAGGAVIRPSALESVFAGGVGGVVVAAGSGSRSSVWGVALVGSERRLVGVVGGVR